MEEPMNRLSGLVVDAAYGVHVRLGPGLLESVYERVLAHELKKRGLQVARQVSIDIKYDDLVLREAFRADLIVNNALIVEVKSLESLQPVHSKQVLTYLKLADKKLGLLLNFGAPVFRDGIVRLVNGL